MRTLIVDQRDSGGNDISRPVKRRGSTWVK